MNTFANKAVLVTGGSSGLGFEMARQLVGRGAAVSICGRSQERLEKASRLVPELSIIRCDVTEAESRRALYDEVLRRHGRQDLLVNNAGVGMRYLLAKAEDLERRVVEEWRTNFLAPLLLAQQFLDLLARSSGTLVNVSSGLAYVPLSVEPSYCASKAALHSMTQSMRLQYSKSGVKVAEIFYPAVDTPFQGGRAPANALPPAEAAALALRGLEAGKPEIRVRMAALIYAMSRLMPGRALKTINGFIPDNVEELLAKE